MKGKVKDILRKPYLKAKDMALQMRKPVYDSKVFCIGFNKTGTTTIGKSLEVLGYRNSSFNPKVWREWYKHGKIDEIIEYTARFESCDDLPWLKEDMIPLLDEKFPGSKFIYLEREEQAWKKSFKNWTYQMTGEFPDVDQAYQNYLNHRKFVLDYFKDRSDKEFIVLEIVDPNGFKKLGDFLGKDAPTPHFPHFNKTQFQGK